MKVPGGQAYGLDMLRAVAWTVGICMIVAAVLLPFAHRYLYVAPFKARLAETVDRAVDRQKTELVSRERFDLDAAAELAAGDPRIETEARMLADGRVLVRAMTAAGAVRSDWLPAMIYERIVDPDGRSTEGAWLIDG